MASSLRQLDNEIWDSELRFKQGLLRMRVRMTVLRLPSGGLLLYSPIRIDEDLARELAELGPVEHIVAPSCLHDLHSGAAKRRYPDAKLWGAPGLAARRPDLAFDAVLGEAPAEWSNSIECLLLQGIPRINEVVFYHTSSRTLVCADFLFNIQDEASTLTRLFWRMFGVWRRLTLSRVFKWMIKDRGAFSRCVARILAWDVQRISMGHGDVVPDAQAKLRVALQGFAGALELTAGAALDKGSA